MIVGIDAGCIKERFWDSFGGTPTANHPPLPDSLMALMLTQLDEILKEFRILRGRSKWDDISDVPRGEAVRFVSRARASIHRIAGEPSTYVDQCEEIIRAGGYPGHQAQEIVGVVDSLRADIAAGYLDSQRQLVRGELFADFLELGQHLLDEGYKDPAAVVAGSSLEVHLRLLCHKSGIDTAQPAGGELAPKKAARLNDDLARVQAYSQLDHKNVNAWLDLRNRAAHGHFDQYEAAQVRLLILGIREFITRNPA